MKHFIITGASKGLGEGVAMALLDEGHHLLCISRGESEALKRMAAAKNCPLDFIRFDLSYTEEIPALCRQVFSLVDTATAEGIYLVNNAGVIEPVGRAEGNSPDMVDAHLRINLLAPMILVACFIEAFHDVAVEKRILNVSSGAANFPYYGWSSYCTGKAGINMFSRCIALEQQTARHPVEVMAAAPGIIDTGMQTTLRNTTDEQFIDREKFIEYKESGMLVAPALAGKRLAALLLSAEFKSGTETDLRD